MKKFIKCVFGFICAVFVAMGFVISIVKADMVEQEYLKQRVDDRPRDIVKLQSEIVIAEPTPEPESELIKLGEFKLTAYCSCSKCCGKWANCRPVDEYGNEIVLGASGEKLTAGYSLAVDPKLIPYGTKLLINGQIYEAQDCGGAIKDKRIDVYFNNHSDAVEFGVQYADVYTLEV